MELQPAIPAQDDKERKKCLTPVREAPDIVLEKEKPYLGFKPQGDLRNFLLISASLAMLLHACSGLIICFGFGLNKQYIAENLCIRRDDPDNHCQGSCYLKKKFHEVQVSDAAQGKELPESPSFPLICEAYTHPVFDAVVIARAAAHIDPRSHLLAVDQIQGGKIFHPPDFLA